MPKHKSGYLLPPENEIETPERICVQFQMPNTEEYRIAVMGQVFELCKWWSWDKTEKGDTRASRASHMFRDTALETFQFIDDCLQAGTPVIFRQTECTLEVSTDEGETWSIIFDATPCKPVIEYIDGSIVVDGEVIVEGDTIINNVIIQPDTDHIKGDGLDKRCNLATYLVELPLPSLMSDTLTEHANANGDSTALLLGLMGLAAVVVTGGLALGAVPALSAGLALGGIATAGAYTAVQGVLNQIDINLATSEQTPQFWQDVKCAIYCALGNDAILDDETMVSISENIQSDIIPSYPNAGELINVIMLTASEQARGQWQIYGSLYDGHDCDLCACGTWIHQVGEFPYTSKYITLHGTTAHVPNGKFWDAAQTLRSGLVTVEIDLSKTPAWITGAVVFATTYRDAGDSRQLGGYARAWVWDETAKDWAQVYGSGISEYGADVFRNFNGGLPGQPYPMLTTKFKVELYAWGENANLSWQNNFIARITLYGAGLDVFQIELDEFNGV